MRDRILLALCLATLYASVSDGCMATTRMSRYVPSVSLNWWRSNVTAINQTLSANHGEADGLTNTTQKQNGSNRVSGKRDDNNQPKNVPLLPIRVEQDPQRPEFYRVVSSSEIPMPKPLFVVPYSPSPALTSPSTEDPRVLWNKIRDSHKPPDPQIDLPGATPWWTSIRVNSVADPHIAEPSSIHETKMAPVPVFADLPNSGSELNLTVANMQDSRNVSSEHANLPGITTVVMDITKVVDYEKEIKFTNSTSLENVEREVSQEDRQEEPPNRDSENLEAITTKSTLTNLHETTSLDAILKDNPTTIVAPATSTPNLATNSMKSSRSKRPQATRNTVRSETLSSIIQTMPLNSVIVVVGGEQQNENLILGTPVDIQVQKNTTRPTLTTFEEGNVATETPTNIPGESKKPTDSPTQALSSEVAVVSNTEQLISQQPSSDTASKGGADNSEITTPLSDFHATNLRAQDTYSDPAYSNESSVTSNISLNQAQNSTYGDMESSTLSGASSAVTVAVSSTNEALNTTTLPKESSVSDVDSIERTSTRTIDKRVVPTETLGIEVTYASNIALPMLDIMITNPTTEETSTERISADISFSIVSESSTGIATTEASISPVHLNKSSIINAFQGLVISASTDSALGATVVSEPSSINPTEKIRLVNEEQVLVERIPHSVPQGEDRHSALQGDSIISSVLEIINASSHTEKPKGIFSFSPTLAAILNHARVRKQSNEPPLVYYYWKQARSRHFSLLPNVPVRSNSNSPSQ
ncbi:uncharacterized protein LOC111267117 isoform X3 [Varroa jacobsoni]|uniref:uncharacterized protein LOC111267117 isoform X3 n=1 Tax=Varroa jacobsoni TaxID=62625 RepID=UPI000BF90696|nr:uncharacterized protein LOC111267117 isoform X3 [Varroa jacobsoni]